MDVSTLKEVIRMVERFSDKELGPRALELDDYFIKGYPRELLGKAKEIGLLSFLLPEPDGGIGGSPQELSLVLEVISQKDAGFASIILSHSIAQYLMLVSSARINPDELFCFPLYIDPENLEGSSIDCIKAEKGKLKISGRMRMVAGGGIADSFLIPVKEPDGLSWFYGSFRDAGMKRSKPTLTLGLRSSAHSDVIFEDALIDETNRIGGIGSAKKSYLSISTKFYPCVSGILLGIIYGSAMTAISYGLERYQGGDIIANHQQMRIYYARMLSSYYSLKSALEKIAFEDGDEFSSLSLKIVASEASVNATIDGVQLLGGYGYMHDYGQEKRMRDARQAVCILGTSRWQLLELAGKFIERLR